MHVWYVWVCTYFVRKNETRKTIKIYTRKIKKLRIKSKNKAHVKTEKEAEKENS
jgi:hypothetical protein